MAHDASCGPDHLSEDEAEMLLLRKWEADDRLDARIDMYLQGAEEAAKEAHLDETPIDD